MSAALPQHLLARLSSRTRASPDAAPSSSVAPKPPPFVDAFRAAVSAGLQIAAPESTATELVRLQNSLNNEAPALSKYDYRMCLAALRPLQDSLAEETRNQEFKFAPRVRAPAPATAPAPVAAPATAPAPTPLAPGAPAGAAAMLAKRTSLLVAKRGDVTIMDLSDCDVVLLDVVDAVYLTNLTRCRVFLGPVRGSVLCRALRECCVQAAARQVRIHDSHQSGFFLLTASGPVIETSSGLEFGPYTLQYPGSEPQLAASAGLAVDNGKWKLVKDFGWLKNTPSPNFVLRSDRMAMHAELADGLAGMFVC